MKMLYLTLLLFLSYTNLSFANDRDLKCSKVVEIAYKNEYKSVVHAVNLKASKYNNEIKVDKVRILRKYGRWYIIDCTFNEVDPAIIVLHRDKKGIHIVEGLSGNINSEGLKDTKEVIYDYFVSNIPTMPKELIYCTVPQMSDNW